MDEVLYPLIETYCRLSNLTTTLSNYDFYTEHGSSHDAFIERYNKLIIEENLLNIGTIDKIASDAIKSLKDDGYQIVICTVRGVGHASEISAAAQAQTIDWLDRNGVEHDELWFTSNKNDARTSCFFDDYILHYEALEREGGCIPWLFDRPYNRSFGSCRRISSFRELRRAVEWSRRIQDNNGPQEGRDQLLV